MRPLRVTAATSSARAIAMLLGPHRMKLAKQQCPIRRKQEHGKEPGQEEHGGVEQGEDAEP